MHPSLPLRQVSRGLLALLAQLCGQKAQLFHLWIALKLLHLRDLHDVLGHLAYFGVGLHLSRKEEVDV